MTTRRTKVWGASVALFILTVGGLFTLFQVDLDIWMTAYPFANTSEWHSTPLYSAGNNHRDRVALERHSRMAISTQTQRLQLILLPGMDDSLEEHP